MADLTPKIGLKKPVVNVETDWGTRLNESFDILDDTVLSANVTGKGTVTVTDDGFGNVTISGTANAETVDNAITGSDGITITSGTSTTDVGGFRTEFVSSSGSLQTQLDTKSHDTLTNLSNDDHSQYPLLTGRSGGQILIGGTGAGDDGKHCGCSWYSWRWWCRSFRPRPKTEPVSGESPRSACWRCCSL